MRKSRCSLWTNVLLVIILGVVTSYSQDLNYLRMDYSSDVKNNIVQIYAAQFDYEYRRIGGVRNDIVKDIIEKEFISRSDLWSRHVVAMCDENVINCMDFIEKATKQVEYVEKEYKKTAEYDLKIIQSRAEWQTLSMKQQMELLREALVKGHVGMKVFEISAGETAIMIFRNGITELYAEVEKAKGSTLKHDHHSFQPYEEVARAKKSSDALAALLKIVHDGALWEQKRKYGPAKERKHLSDEDRDPVRVANIAIIALRKINLSGTIDGLKEVMKIYAPYKAIDDEKRKSLSNNYNARQPSPTNYLGEVGRNISETIGDFGDRNFERETLGGRCFWDIVHEAEVKMVEMKMIKKGQMLTSEEQK